MRKLSLAAASMTRRDILAAFLGLPLALAGCARRSPDGDFGGEIVGPSEALGHRLRDARPPTPAADQWQRSPVVIIGGGVAGLGAAWRFDRASFQDYTLLELENVAGGTSRSGTGPLVPYPWGAHYIPTPLKDNRLLVTLLGEMGILEQRRDAEGQPVVAEQFLCRDPQERVFYMGRWHEGLYLHAGEDQDDIAQLAKYRDEIARWVGWRDARGRRAFILPTASCSDDPRVTDLDKITLADWLDRQQLTSPRLRWLLDYECRDDYGARLDQISAWAGIFYAAARVRKPGAESQPHITWPEGNGKVVNYLYEKVKARVRLGLAVAELVPTDPDGRTGVDAVAVDAGRGVVGYHADQVIFAAPQFVGRYVIRPYREKPPAHIAEFQYGAWMVANLFLKARPKDRGFPLAWDNVLYDAPRGSDVPSLGYVVATHQESLERGPTVFTYYFPMCDANPADGRKRLNSLGWKDCTDIVLTDLERAHPEIRTLVERIDIMRWGHAMIRPRPGFVWGGARGAAAKPYRGIHFANADLSGVGLFEEAFYHGCRAAEEVLTARGIKFESML